MKEKSKKRPLAKTIILISAVLVIAVGLVIAGVVLFKPANETMLLQGESYKLNIEKFEPQVIAEGLQINYIGDYSGVFFEDGNDEIVSSVLMVELQNTSENDLQLVRIKAVAEDSVAEFEGTNVPAGESIILLEKNKMKAVSLNVYDFSVENVVLFSEKMNTMDESFSVAFGDGYLELTNMSDTDTEGVIYLYYKNTADNKLYGGITYRATINEVVAKGDSVRVITNHCTEKNTEIVNIVNVKG